MRKDASYGYAGSGKNQPGGLHRRKFLLVWDRFSVHLIEGVTKVVKATNIAVIPGGLTVSLNKAVT